MSPRKAAAAAIAGVALVTVVASGAGADELATGTAPLRDLGDWVSFYASFDQDASADLAAGQPAPVRQIGAVRLEPGVRGNAILLGSGAGGVELTYALPGNLDVSRPGAASFWVANSNWREPGAKGGSSYVRMLRIVGTSGAALLFERDHRPKSSDRELFIAGLFELPGRRSYMTRFEAGRTWRKGAWHLLVLSWDGTGFSVSVDGAPLARISVPQDLLPLSIEPGKGAVFRLGDRGSEAFIMDDFTVYARGLQQTDVDRLWQGPSARTQ